jgi:transposase
MQQHLEAISKEIAPGNHGVIVVDQAAWHTTKNLIVPKNISLLFLPPASPELNPTEQLWQVLRDRYLANRSFASYDDIVNSSCDAWNAFTSTTDAVRQLCSRNWARTKTYF